MYSQVFDAGDYFMLTRGDDEKLVAVCSREDGYQQGDDSVFLVDHAVTYQSADVRKLLDDPR